MSTTLVTGATGNVGKHIVSSLARAGLPVRALVRDPRRAELPARAEAVAGTSPRPRRWNPRCAAWRAST
ncbi:NAD(P)H-binding protein [Actinomadura sp. J1-007]|uniref:NmrA family NAD(P)-binding protein n=1 Tax=Actinomadura sp. J1-007 TaxID=2661913 RepID=UPI002815F062|nr:NAD(P)H-binding protein [Actinomadura sp. J1-007]